MSSNPDIQAALGFVKGQNDKYHFVNNLISKIGYPIWDKSKVFNNVQAASGRGNTGDSNTVVYVPFVIDTQSHVNATLMLKMAPTDTAFRFLADWEYKNYSFDSTGSANSWRAKDIFHIFAMMNHSVFGDTQFMVTDGRIFSDSQHKQRLVTIDFEPTGGKAGLAGRNNLLTITFCNVVNACVYVGPSSKSARSSTSSLPCYCSCVTNLYCTTVMIEDGGWVTSGTGGSGGTGGTGGSGGSGTGGSGGTGGTGGTTTGGGGWYYTGCNGTAARGAIYECGTGWYVYNGGGGSGSSTPSEPIDTMLNRTARKINQIADSIHALSRANNNEEWGFIIVKNAAGEIYAKNCTTSHNDKYVQLNKTIIPGEVIVAELHTHSEPGNNPLDRSAASGMDLDKLRISLMNGYTCFVECGNVRYALVNEDVSKSGPFLYQNRPKDLYYTQDAFAKNNPLSNSNWQLSTEQALVDLISSATTGIGIYKSDATKVNFTKIN